jgi:pimeloyl-ACP methyl ester carboxylesterase
MVAHIMHHRAPRGGAIPRISVGASQRAGAAAPHRDPVWEGGGEAMRAPADDRGDRRRVCWGRRTRRATPQLEGRMMHIPWMTQVRCRCALLAMLIGGAAHAAGPAPTGAPREQVVTVLDQRIHYLEAGRGRPVILLHGLGATKEVWLANLAALAAHHHVYAIDQIGFGRSDKPLLDYKIATFVDFLQGFMASQNLDRATLVGNSLGGWVALDFALQHPAMVDRLVLVDSAGLTWMHPSPVDLNPASLAATRALLQALFYDKRMVSDQLVHQVFTEHLRNNDGYTIQRALAGFASQFEDGKLGAVRAPTLVVWGRQDEMIPVASGEKLRDGISGAKLVVFDHCGHTPQLEKAAELTRAMLDFLGE